MNIKPIEGYEHYFVDDEGNIYSDKLKFGWASQSLHRIVTFKNGSGYESVNLCLNRQD